MVFMEKAMKVAIVHDWLTAPGGAEKVLDQILQLWPDADIYAVVDFMKESDRGFLKGKKITTSFIQNLPFARHQYRNYLPFMPIAIEQLDLTSYELVISSSYAVAKGIVSGPDAIHVCYCHSPVRYGWDLQHQYLRESGLEHGLKSMVARVLLHYLRIWDVRTAFGVDVFVANSEFTARRIRKAYGRSSLVIHPPVKASELTCGTGSGDYYVSVSRLVPYKRMDLIAEAFSAMPDKKLILIGDGPDLEKIRSKAGPNVQVLGGQPWAVVVEHLANAKAFIFAAEEDFGIAPVEAQACGTPVIGFGRGGLLETTVPFPSPFPTAVYFKEQTVDSLCTAVKQFESLPIGTFNRNEIRAHALQFDQRAFRLKLTKAVELAIQQKENRHPPHLRDRRRGLPEAFNDRVSEISL
jgi:glycosyltransferase involved in cell wall biosynthesis